jgi:hypothetical protein
VALQQQQRRARRCLPMGPGTHTCAAMVWGRPPTARPTGEDHPLSPMPPALRHDLRCQLGGESSRRGRGPSPPPHHVGGDHLERGKIISSSPALVPLTTHCHMLDALQGCSRVPSGGGDPGTGEDHPLVCATWEKVTMS